MEYKGFAKDDMACSIQAAGLQVLASMKAIYGVRKLNQGSSIRSSLVIRVLTLPLELPVFLLVIFTLTYLNFEPRPVLAHRDRLLNLQIVIDHRRNLDDPEELERLIIRKHDMTRSSDAAAIQSDAPSELILFLLRVHPVVVNPFQSIQLVKRGIGLR